MIQFAQEQQLKTPIKLIYANHDQNIPFKNELNAASASSPNLDVEHVVSHPDASWTGTHGRVDETYLKKNVPGFAPNSQYYIVGPPAMVTSVKGTLQELGIPENRISIEIFPGSAPKQSIAKSAENSATKAEHEAETESSCSAGENHVCVCQSVSEKVIRLAIKNGATTPEQIRTQTNAGTACGRCMPEIMGMVCEPK
jgi:ferredoxin-NADP reductase